MSMLLDRKYTGFVTNRLRDCSSVKTDVWNSHCPFCDGSTTNPNKRTFYIYPKDGKLIAYCHVCQSSNEIIWFLRKFDEQLYRDYQKENFLESRAPKTRLEKPKTVRKHFLDLSIKTPSDASKIDYKDILEGTPFIPLSELPDDHITKLYLRSRMIPEQQWERLAYITKMSKIFEFYPDYKNLEKSTEDRLVMPLISREMKLIGVSCRSLKPTALQRYVEIKFDPDAEMVFGMERLNLNETKYVFEGGMDSMLMANSIAVVGLSVAKLDEIGIDKESTVIILDNQPKHKNLVAAVGKVIDRGFKICLLPHSYIGKDFNDMLQNGEIKLDSMKEIIDNNVYQGLRAKNYFSKWRKI